MRCDGEGESKEGEERERGRGKEKRQKKYESVRLAKMRRDGKGMSREGEEREGDGDQKDKVYHAWYRTSGVKTFRSDLARCEGRAEEQTGGTN